MGRAIKKKMIKERGRMKGKLGEGREFGGRKPGVDPKFHSKL